MPGTILDGRIQARLRAALPDAAAATGAAALAWTLSRLLFGHPHPVFAAVAATTSANAFA